MPSDSAESKITRIVISAEGNFYGPFETAEAIASFVKQKWPGQPQDLDNDGGGDHKGWNVWVLQPPIV